MCAMCGCGKKKGQPGYGKGKASAKKANTAGKMSMKKGIVKKGK